MVGQNLSLKLEVQGDNQLNEVHSSRTVNWTTPNKRYSFALRNRSIGAGCLSNLTLLLVDLFFDGCDVIPQQECFPQGLLCGGVEVLLGVPGAGCVRWKRAERVVHVTIRVLDDSEHLFLVLGLNFEPELIESVCDIDRFLLFVLVILHKAAVLIEQVIQYEVKLAFGSVFDFVRRCVALNAVQFQDTVGNGYLVWIKVSALLALHHLAAKLHRVGNGRRLVPHVDGGDDGVTEERDHR